VSFTIARTMDDALTALAAGARPIAGGTDLVVGARHGKAPLPADLVAIDRLTELKAVTQTSLGVTCGVRPGSRTDSAALLRRTGRLPNPAPSPREVG